jgi:4-amino-4-deoxy-L-arabinose transferase-like glycosyltransferase
VAVHDVAGQPAARSLARIVRPNAAALVIGLSVALRVPLLALPITYRNDIWRQADTASIARNFLTEPNVLYPQINWGGAGPGYVESEFQLYPWTVSLLYRLFGEHVWLGRAVSLAATTVALYLFWRLAQRLLAPCPALIALTFFAICPLVLRYSTEFMPEATLLAAYLGALLLFVRWLEDRRWSTALWCGAATALAGLVKPTALNLCLVFLVVLLLRHEWRRILTLQTVAFTLVALAPVAAWLWHGARLHAEYGNTFGVISGGDSKFGSIAIWTSPGFYLGVARIDLLWVFAVAAAPLAVIGLAIAVRRGVVPLVPAGAVAIAVYYLAVARYAQGDLGIQYHVFTVVYAALAVGIGTDLLLVWRGSARTRARVLAVVAAVAYAAGAVVAYADQFRDWGSEALACGAAVQSVIPSGDLVVITSDDVADDNGTPNNYQDPTLFFHGDRRGWSVAADQDRPALVERHRLEGARWLVMSGAAAREPGPGLATYVADRPQRGPGLEAGCGIYELGG